MKNYFFLTLLAIACIIGIIPSWIFLLRSKRGGWPPLQNSYNGTSIPFRGGQIYYQEIPTRGMRYGVFLVTDSTGSSDISVVNLTKDSIEINTHL
jgi:hypothetical protein